MNERKKSCCESDTLTDPVHGTTRRAFLGAAIATASISLLGTSEPAEAAAPATGADNNLTPAEALTELMEGNARFVAGKPTAHLKDLSIIRARSAEGQWPVAGVLACADSRVPVEMVFDEYIGRLFVTRVAGNITTPEIIASIEYGVAVLGLKLLVVLGHTQCGAVTSAIGNPEVPGQISALFPSLLPAIYASRSRDPAVVTRTNAVVQAGTLMHSSPVIAAKIKSGELKVMAGVYDVATGKVELLEVPAGFPVDA